MIFKAWESDQSKFLSLPESGMGYQIIEAKLYRKTEKNRFVVYNSELIVDLDIQFLDFKRKIIMEGYSAILSKVEKLLIETSTISLVPRKQITEYRLLTESKKKEKGRHSGGKGAVDNPKETASGGELFARLSAYENDKRIDFINKKLKSGTFATTNDDYNVCVRTNDDPIDRYALPNDETIKWTFYIQPKKDDILQRGIVQPAFGHDGGGIEAYFEYGTSEKTYLEKRAYGK
jgi:hypothetical protein